MLIRLFPQGWEQCVATFNATTVPSIGHLITVGAIEWRVDRVHWHASYEYVSYLRQECNLDMVDLAVSYVFSDEFDSYEDFAEDYASRVRQDYATEYPRKTDAATE